MSEVSVISIALGIAAAGAAIACGAELGIVLFCGGAMTVVGGLVF